MEEVIKSSKEFVEKNPDYILFHLGYGISVIKKPYLTKEEFMKLVLNKTKCVCGNKSALKTWNSKEKEWVNLCLECIKP